MDIKLTPREWDEKFRLALAANRGTIRTFARNCVHQLPGYDIEDIEQELTLKLWDCVIKYDPNRGAAFRTLFIGTARNHVIGLVRAATTQKRGRDRVVHMAAEDFQRAAERMRSDGSAEDWYFALDSLGTKFARELDIAHDRQRAVA